MHLQEFEPFHQGTQQHTAELWIEYLLFFWLKKKEVIRKVKLEEQLHFYQPVILII